MGKTAALSIPCRPRAHPGSAARFAGRDPGPGARQLEPVRTPPLNLRQQLLHAAMENGGELTVGQGVLATGKTFEQVEKALNGMSDKGYVDVDNAPGTGVLVYRFPDLLSKPRSG